MTVSPEALAADEDFDGFIEAKRKAGGTTAALWNRAQENARRLALVLAVGEAAEIRATAVGSPNEAAGGGSAAGPVVVISGETMQVAVDLVRVLVTEYGRQVAGRVHASDAAEIRAKLLDAIRRHAGPDGWARQRDVLRAFNGSRFDGSRVRRELDGLVDSEAVEKRGIPPSTAGGRPGLQYRIA